MRTDKVSGLRKQESVTEVSKTRENSAFQKVTKEPKLKQRRLKNRRIEMKSKVSI